MTTFDVVSLMIVSCGLLIGLFCMWALYCNQKTSRARHRLIDHVYGKTPTQNQNWRELSALYRQTSHAYPVYTYRHLC